MLSTVGRSRLGKKYDDVEGASLPTFEYLRQRGGMMLYETRMTEKEGMLVINKPGDLVYVFANGVCFIYYFILFLSIIKAFTIEKKNSVTQMI